jgi:hypothetical protein
MNSPQNYVQVIGENPNAVISDKDLQQIDNQLPQTVKTASESSFLNEEAQLDATPAENSQSLVDTAKETEIADENGVKFPLIPVSTDVNPELYGDLLKLMSPYQTGGIALEAAAASATTSLSIAAIFPTIILPTFLLITKCLYWAVNKTMTLANTTLDNVFSGALDIGGALKRNIMSHLEPGKPPQLTPEFASALLQLSALKQQAVTPIVATTVPVPAPVGGRKKQSRRRQKGGADELKQLGNIILPNLTKIMGGNNATIGNMTTMFLSKINKLPADTKYDTPEGIFSGIFEAPTGKFLSFSLNPFNTLMTTKNIGRIKSLATFLIKKGTPLGLILGGGEGQVTQLNTNIELAILGGNLDNFAKGLEIELNTPNKKSWWNRITGDSIDAIDLFQKDVLSRAKCLEEYINIMNKQGFQNLNLAPDATMTYNNIQGLDGVLTSMNACFKHANKIQKYLMIKDSAGNWIYDPKQHSVSNCTWVSGTNNLTTRPICHIRYFVKQFDKNKTIFENKILPQISQNLKGGAKRIVYKKLTLQELKALARERKVPGRTKLVTKEALIDALRNQPKSKKFYQAK